MLDMTTFSGQYYSFMIKKNAKQIKIGESNGVEHSDMQGQFATIWV